MAKKIKGSKSLVKDGKKTAGRLDSQCPSVLQDDEELSYIRNGQKSLSKSVTRMVQLKTAENRRGVQSPPGYPPNTTTTITAMNCNVWKAKLYFFPLKW